ncbi:hypothetical protein B195_012465 [Pseudomonas sp. Lz4W]|uniref:HNH endonuclease signature motif containing protein n=1 Tax=Pseudomonas sp. Lz4W TaxID=1206777 RepID=UPI0002BF4C4C|nr:HNH endonuclease signature motif containing protein [Pseudomonas sp. Lz4W]AUB75618.1 hypothetical protein B195_012465 [Pseudomonas sp. Lz4W]
MTTTSAVNFHELFVIDPTSESGLKWLVSGTGRRPDLRVGSKDTMGYWKVCYKRKAYMVHRIIWEMVNGPIPAAHVIDHRNGDVTDNRRANLRLATTMQNGLNQSGKGRRFLPKSVSLSDVGQVIVTVDKVRLIKSFSIFNDDSSELINNAIAIAHDAILEAHGEFANVSSFYSAVPDEAVMGPDTGHP